MTFTTRIDADVPEGRTLHLIDVENLAGGPHVSAEVAHAAIDHYQRTAQWQPTDLTRLACNPWLFMKLAFDLPAGGLTRFGHGADGADRALLAGLDPETVTRRFHRLVIGSGDHCFTDLAAGVRALGGDAWVISRHGSLSRDLERAASRVVIDLSDGAQLVAAGDHLGPALEGPR
jgi:hypothetical protein